MARGDMLFESVDIGGQVEILNRSPFEGVPMTIDFTSVSTTDPDSGEKVVRAGMPISAAGAEVKTTPWTGAVGILLHDVYESRPQGTILKKAYINETAAEANASVTYDDALYKLFPMIVFETGK
ncbi:hypothetical protein [Bacteroides clarus]|uniref:hypothetical protein n=1 Tax=Bacteroides clarus TaxID=626929 RepID=UPI00248EE2E3|nr:hypothetical protein [Bacteroides clarus]